MSLRKGVDEKVYTKRGGSSAAISFDVDLQCMYSFWTFKLATNNCADQTALIIHVAVLY